MIKAKGNQIKAIVYNSLYCFGENIFRTSNIEPKIWGHIKEEELLYMLVTDGLHL